MLSVYPHYKSHHNGSTYLVSGHFSECLLQFLSDRLELLLLGDQFVLQPVHLLLQLHHRLLRKLGPDHRLVQLGGQSLDLFLVSLLSLVCLLLSPLQRFQVISHNPQLFLKVHNLGLSDLSSLFSLLQIGFTLSQFLGHFIISRISSLRFLLASFKSFSSAVILFSSSSALLWKTFLARSESSEADAALSSLLTAATIFSSVFSRSSSSPDTRLLRAFISSSVAASSFSFSSSCRDTIPSFSVVRSGHRRYPSPPSSP